MKTLYAVIILLLSAITSNAQTFHAIVFCNTIDRSIGESMTLELANVSRNLGVLEKLLENNYYFSITRIDGSNCTRENVKATIEDLEVDSDDIIFVFYGGHGSHAVNNRQDPWPQFCMNTGDQAKWVPMAHVDKWVSAKRPRLSIIVANCCNVEQPGVSVKPMWANNDRATSLDGMDANAFLKLFSSKGRILTTSSKLGQYSWCNRVCGGIFTNQFWESMWKIGKGDIKPDFESFLASAGAELTVQTNEGPVKQTPYYETYLNNNKSPITRHIDKDKATTLSAAISKLTDKSISQSSRLEMIPGILHQFFNSSSKVISVASDMKTNIDYEDASDFLRRICLSPYIKGITILNDDPSYLKIHELR